jgi:transposase
MDAGYFSESNICDLYGQKINFLTRMPSGIKIYKNIISNKVLGIENLKNASILNSRSFYIKTLKINLYENDAYAYVILDPERKAKEAKDLLQKYCNNKNHKDGRNEEKYKFELLSCGIMILVSSKKILTSEVLSSYYLRQSVEQVFSFSKSDLSLLPLRNHNEKTVRGYLFFQFLLLIIYLKIREEISNQYTVEQTLLILRKLKCKIFDTQIIPSEPTKKQRLIFDKSKITVPKFITI